jgi:hypothetical protein
MFVGDATFEIVTSPPGGRGDSSVERDGVMLALSGRNFRVAAVARRRTIHALASVATQSFDFDEPLVGVLESELFVVTQLTLQ